MPDNVTPPPAPARPNILLIMVDQMRFPRFAYGEQGGFVDPLKQIFGFQGHAHDSNAFKDFFPGLWALRDNAVVLRNHRIASSACVPSRTVVFSGQYGTITKATQTDGVLKNGADRKFPWLDPDDFPTLGDWMRANGYTSHYFGKWHVSGEATTDLEGYGFSDWELSYPDPHGTLPNNLGHYRDYQFADIVTSFLRRRGLGIPYCVQHAAHNVAEATKRERDDVEEPQDPPAPWFAVASFTNPHDIGSFPIPRAVYDANVEGAPYTLAVPPKGAKGTLPKGGTMAIDLNPLGFPQNNADVPPTWDEKLRNKPSCQLDYVYKWGLALMSKAGLNAATSVDNPGTKREQLARAVKVTLASNASGMPLALTDNPELACRAFIQYYAYAIQQVDQHIDRVLRALDESGQADNTIVIFAPDHGEYAGAHNKMSEKWHSAYEEFTHVPVVVRFPDSLHVVPGGTRQVDELTSHADLLPTILGLAGVKGPALKATLAQLRRTHDKSYMPVGSDLSELLYGRAARAQDPETGRPREGVLFMTHDTITAPLDGETQTDLDDESVPLSAYDVFLAAVDELRKGREDWPDEVEDIAPGEVCQPCLVNAVVSRDNWKLVRYHAPADQAPEVPDQYELYDLDRDPTEEHNLLVFNGEFPTPAPLQSLPEEHHPRVDVAEKAEAMMALLRELEQRMLVEPVRAEPT